MNLTILYSQISEANFKIEETIKEFGQELIMFENNSKIEDKERE